MIGKRLLFIAIVLLVPTYASGVTVSVTSHAISVYDLTVEDLVSAIDLADMPNVIMDVTDDDVLIIKIVDWYPHRKIRYIQHTIYAKANGDTGGYDFWIMITAQTRKPYRYIVRRIARRRVCAGLSKLLNLELQLYEKYGSFEKIYDKLGGEYGL